MKHPEDELHENANSGSTDSMSGSPVQSAEIADGKSVTDGSRSEPPIVAEPVVSSADSLSSATREDESAVHTQAHDEHSEIPAEAAHAEIPAEAVNADIPSEAAHEEIPVPHLSRSTYVPVNPDPTDARRSGSSPWDDADGGDADGGDAGASDLASDRADDAAGGPAGEAAGVADGSDPASDARQDDLPAHEAQIPSPDNGEQLETGSHEATAESDAAPSVAFVMPAAAAPADATPPTVQATASEVGADAEATEHPSAVSPSAVSPAAEPIAAPPAAQPADAHHDQDAAASTEAQHADLPAPAEKKPAARSSFDDSTPLARELAEITRRRHAIEAEALPLPGAPRIFTVANQKGGVGKTTTTVNLAAALARAGARVLVIDLDPQGNASTALGVDHRSDTVSVYDVIINDERMADVVQKSPEFEGLYCVPATIHLAGAEIELVSLVAREQRLHTALERFLNEAEQPFHYVFIDCPPSLGLLTINAFVAAREVLIPIQCEYYALEGLSQLLSNIKLIERHLNPKLAVSTILLTMYDGRTNLANQVAEEVREHFPNEVLETLIPRSVRISEAPSYGQSVISYDPTSPGSLSYLEAASEIARRGAPE